MPLNENTQIYMGDPPENSMNPPRFDVGSDGRTTPRYLFTVDGNHPKKILPIVCSLVGDAEAELLIGYPVIEQERPSLEAPDPMREGTRLAAKYDLVAKEQCESIPAINYDVIGGVRRDSIIQTMIERNSISTFVTGEQPRSGIRSILGFDAYGEASIPDTCDTIIVGQIGNHDSIDSILVPVGRGPHSEYAIETGLALARQNDATLELVHVSEAGDEDSRTTGENILEHGFEKLQGFEAAEQTLIEADDVTDAIIEHSNPFDITVFGAPREGLLRQFMLGSVPKTAEDNITGTVLIAHKGGANRSWVDHLL